VALIVDAGVSVTVNTSHPGTTADEPAELDTSVEVWGHDDEYAVVDLLAEDDDANVYASASADGIEQWGIEIGSVDIPMTKPHVSPTIVDDTLYAGGGENNMHALSDV
jgi:hypothetical protein